MKSRYALAGCIGVAIIVLSYSATAQSHGHKGHMMGASPAGGAQETPYAGQEKRAIKSLSARDIDDLENGRGWGLAKAAELNGMPGPKHLLEMKDKIALTAEQAAAIGKLYAAMKGRAVALGKRLVALEGILNAAFAGRDIDETRLRVTLDKIGRVRAELRYVHLATHLKTPALLSSGQIEDYNRLRGYRGSPAMPKGH